MSQPKNDNREALQRWMHRVQVELGQVTGQLVIKSLIEECGGCRISLPDMQDLYREAEIKKIRALYAKGSTYEELSINFDRSIRHIRRIVHRQD